ncbi:uncharacterized protein LOC113472981, partial [Diaphorina citri]|uniref:Uncharacterized protein LOC113472981 n=1 Tax=Diaphorina citri TaxID=121845 RepID=A0A3Q0JP05_DIACI
MKVPKDLDLNWRKIRYLNEDCLKIGEEFKKVGIQPAFYNDKTTGKFLINNKPRSDIDKKSGIYSIKCADCDAMYIGMTMRSIGTRVSEHLRGPDSHVDQHMSTTGHSFDMSNVSLLHGGNKRRKLCCLEMMYIQEAVERGANMLNGQLKAEIVLFGDD